MVDITRAFPVRYLTAERSAVSRAEAGCNACPPGPLFWVLLELRQPLGRDVGRRPICGTVNVVGESGASSGESTGALHRLDILGLHHHDHRGVSISINVSKVERNALQFVKAGVFASRRRYWGKVCHMWCVQCALSDVHELRKSGMIWGYTIAVSKKHGQSSTIESNSVSKLLQA